MQLIIYDSTENPHKFSFAFRSNKQESYDNVKPKNDSRNSPEVTAFTGKSVLHGLAGGRK